MRKVIGFLLVSVSVFHSSLTYAQMTETSPLVEKSGGGLCTGASETDDKTVFCFENEMSQNLHRITYERVSPTTKKLDIELYNYKKRVFDKAISITLTKDATGRGVIVDTDNRGKKGREEFHFPDVPANLKEYLVASNDEEMILVAFKPLIVSPSDSREEQISNEAFLRDFLKHWSLTKVAKKQVHLPDAEAPQTDGPEPSQNQPQ